MCAFFSFTRGALYPEPKTDFEQIESAIRRANPWPRYTKSGDSVVRESRPTAAPPTFLYNEIAGFETNSLPAVPPEIRYPLPPRRRRFDSTTAS